MTKRITLIDSLKEVDKVLCNAVSAVTDLITQYGILNVDFADVTAVMTNMGRAMMGVGFGEGEHRAILAAKEAVHSPLLEDVDIKGAKGLLVNITSPADVAMEEVAEIMEYLNQFASQDLGDEAVIKYGHCFNHDPEWGNKIRVTLIATGLGDIAPVVPASEFNNNQQQQSVAVEVENPVEEQAPRPQAVGENKWRPTVTPDFIR